MNWFIYLITFQWLWPSTPKESAEDKANRTIRESSAALEQTERDLETSAEYVRKKNGRVNLLQQDADVLRNRVREAMPKGKEAARPIMEELIGKEKELAEAKTTAADALASHKKLERQRDEHRSEIRKAKEQLEDLKVRGTTAEARNRSANRESLSEATAGLNTEVRTKERSADLNDELKTNPDDQYLQAAGNTNVDERLAQLERELGK